MPGFGKYIAPTIALLALGGVNAIAQKNSPAGIFAAEQAANGQNEYLENCAGCHGNSLAGGNDSPALAGPGFMQSWGNRSTKALYQFVSTTMPVGNAGGLSPGVYTDIVAFLLYANGAKPGAAAFTRDTDVRVTAVASGEVPAEIQKGLAPPAIRAQAAAPAIRHGLTVAGTVKNYTPVTDEMLTHPAGRRLADVPAQLSGLEL